MNDAYLTWNAAIAETYFTRDGAGRPAYLAVDDEDLVAISERIGLGTQDPVGDITAAVIEELSGDGPLFRAFESAARTWRVDSRHRYPPYLGLLAIFVLAGSRMERDVREEIRAHDYYARLNLLLDLPVRNRMPPGFDRMGVAWKDLQRWLDTDLKGKFGLSAVHTHPHHTYIGYPLSQCALRARDRLRLYDFFRSRGLDPGTQVTDERLLIMLQAWAAQISCPLTNRGRGAILGSSVEDLANPKADLRGKAIVAIAKHELASWDGQLRDEQGRRRAEMQLWLKTRRGAVAEMAIFAPQPEGFPAGDWKSSDGAATSLTAISGWYSGFTGIRPERLLNNGLTLTSGRYALTFSPSDLVPFRKSLEPESGWLSQPRVSLFEEHLILSRRSLSSAVGDFVSEHADKPLPKPEPLPRAIGSGWETWAGVRLSTVPSGLHPPALDRLVPKLHTATQVSGGLQLEKALYLTRGEPDLHISVEPGEKAIVELDGRREHFDESVRMIPLSQLGMEAGEHLIEAAGRRLSITTTHSLGTIQPNGAGELAQVLRLGREPRPTATIAESVTDEPPLGTVHVCGAHALGAREDLPYQGGAPVVLPAGFLAYYILGAWPGEVDSSESQAEPDWLRELTTAYQYFEVEVAFAPQLMILNGATGWKVRALSDQVAPPDPVSSLPVGVDRWRQVILEAHEHEADVPSAIGDVWSRYVQIAREELLDEP